MRKLCPSLWLCALIGRTILLAGCGLADPREEYVKPTIAVMKFENRAPFPLKWNLGDGMKDVLVDRLMSSRRFRVIERPEIDSVINELRFQNTGLTREQRRAPVGRLANVEYLIKGTITDFGHVSSSRGFLGTGNLSIFGGGNRAVMGLTMYIVEVESGEIIASTSLQESVYAGDVTVKAAYQDVAFGGSVFFRTPLGRATARVIDRAVSRVGETITSRPWEPKLALVQADGTVVINGGRDRGVIEGMQYDVFQRGQPIYDPDSGDLIGHQPGKPAGRVRMTEIRKLYSIGTIIAGRSGELTIGQYCRRCDPAQLGAGLHDPRSDRQRSVGTGPRQPLSIIH